MTAVEKKTWIDKCWCSWVDVGFGCRQYMLFTPDMVAPIGFVWIMAIGADSPTAHVLGSYVKPHFRRRGVRTRINQTLMEHHKVIQTHSGSTGKEGGGEAWMKANGYTHDPIRGDWYLMSKPKPKAAKRRKRPS